MAADTAVEIITAVATGRAGDVLANLNFVLGTAGLREPPSFFSADPSRNRESARKVAALRPALVCFGHGPPLRDPDRLQEYAARLRD